MLFLLFMHEMAHCIAAKMLHLPIEEVGFAWKPFPKFFVAVADKGILFKKKFCFLLSGNLMTLILFLIYLAVGRVDKSVYYAFSYQFIVETNPFSSDYVTIIFSWLFRDRFKRYYSTIGNHQEGHPMIGFEREFKREFMFSKVWYVHFLLWGVLILILLSPVS